MNWVTLSILSASRLIRTVWAAGRGVDPGRTVWQKLAFATVSPRSPCRGAASAWLDDAWDEAAGQWNSYFSDLHFSFSLYHSICGSNAHLLTGNGGH